MECAVFHFTVKYFAVLQALCDLLMCFFGVVFLRTYKILKLLYVISKHVGTKK
jgi:hypothetical protein